MGDARAAEERKMASVEGQLRQQDKAILEKFEKELAKQKLTGDAKIYSEAAAAAEGAYNEFLEDSDEDDAEAAKKIMARGPSRPTGSRSKWATAAQNRSLH